MKRNLILTIVVVAFCIVGLAHVAHAITMDEAKANADKAAEFIKANGMEKARAEICNPHGRFTKGELYVYVMDFNGVHIAKWRKPESQRHQPPGGQGPEWSLSHEGSNRGCKNERRRLDQLLLGKSRQPESSGQDNVCKEDRRDRLFRCLRRMEMNPRRGIAFSVTTPDYH